MPLSVRLLIATYTEMTENVRKTFKENNVILSPHSKCYIYIPFALTI